jgi:hypothetical protein
MTEFVTFILTKLVSSITHFRLFFGFWAILELAWQLIDTRTTKAHDAEPEIRVRQRNSKTNLTFFKKEYLETNEKAKFPKRFFVD